VPGYGFSRLAAPGFTLLELLIAVSVFAIVLAAINAVFFSALRLRNRATALVDHAIPIEQALTILRRDLLSIVPPGTNFLGPLQTAGGSNRIANAVGPVLYCSSGALDETTPWPEIQRVSYALVESTNRFQGMDLVRYADRNLLALTTEVPIPQKLLSGVRSIAFTFYDGSQWREYWDSTSESPSLPLGVRVQLQLEPAVENPNAALPPPLELVVPIMVVSPTDTTANATEG
jgi:type II secretion system protein J